MWNTSSFLEIKPSNCWETILKIFEWKFVKIPIWYQNMIREIWTIPPNNISIVENFSPNIMLKWFEIEFFKWGYSNISIDSTSLSRDLYIFQLGSFTRILLVTPAKLKNEVSCQLHLSTGLPVHSFKFIKLQEICKLKYYHFCLEILVNNFLLVYIFVHAQRQNLFYSFVLTCA